ncbi:MAG: PhoU domain-containing protein [Candidatus Pacearchaeota archaeon]|nr:PhoU domain-containing protein [Candidatus Pacearchaeota archaeon]
MKKFDEKKFEETMLMEDAVDNLQGEIASYIEKTLQKNPKISKDILKKFLTFSSVVDEIERIADRAVNIAQIAYFKNKNKEKFSSETQYFFEELNKKLLLLLSDHFNMLEEKAYNKKYEEEIKEYIKTFKEVYKLKLLMKEESPATTMLFSELIANIERIVGNAETIAKQLSEIY